MSNGELKMMKGKRKSKRNTRRSNLKNLNLNTVRRLLVFIKIIATNFFIVAVQNLTPIKLILTKQ